MHWRPSRGIQSPTPTYRWRGAKLNAGWVTTFNEHAIVSENRLTPIPADYNLRTAPLLGCAATTAVGVINNDAKVKIGESVVVFGAGGVGLNVVQFARMVGAHPIVAVDILDNKLEMAKRLGATHCLNSRGIADDALAKEIRGIAGDKGPDKVMETTGVSAVIELAYDLHPTRTAPAFLSGCHLRKSRSIRCRSTSTRCSPGRTAAIRRPTSTSRASCGCIRRGVWRSTRSSPTNSRSTTSTRRSTWCAAAPPGRRRADQGGAGPEAETYPPVTERSGSGTVRRRPPWLEVFPGACRTIGST